VRFYFEMGATKDPIRDPNYWRERSEETRAKADAYFDPGTKAKLLKVAEEHDRMAERAEQWQRIRPPQLAASFNLECHVQSGMSCRST
jgi:hypothetical protein